MPQVKRKEIERLLHEVQDLKGCPELRLFYGYEASQPFYRKHWYYTIFGEVGSVPIGNTAAEAATTLFDLVEYLRYQKQSVKDYHKRWENDLT